MQNNLRKTTLIRIFQYSLWHNLDFDTSADYRHVLFLCRSTGSDKVFCVFEAWQVYHPIMCLGSGVMSIGYHAIGLRLFLEGKSWHNVLGLKLVLKMAG